MACAPIKTAFDLINKVKSLRQISLASSNALQTLSIGQAKTNLTPLIVHDLCGGFRAATFCALYTIQDLVHMESSVSVYELAKMYHLKRPNIWQSRANIQFLYDCVESLFDEIQSNHQYQFKNYLNLNIDNHFLKNLSDKATLPNHASMTLLPVIQQPSVSHQSQQASTTTLPNLNSSNTNLLNQQGLSTNDAIGSRLYNFQVIFGGFFPLIWSKCHLKIKFKQKN